MIIGMIVGDNFFQSPRTAICRANGAHRIASILRSQGNINVYNLDFINAWSIEELSTLINNIKHLDFLGISTGLGQLEHNNINLLIKLCKTKWPNIKVIAGGNEVLQSKFIGVDLYFLGFAEGVTSHLIKYLETGKFDPFKVSTTNVDGIKKVIDCNKHFPVYDLSNLKITYTKDDFIDELETLTLETSRGCIFKCEFCNFPLTGKKKNEYIRIKEDIKNELVENYNNFGTTRYLITDDTFNDNILKVDMLYEISQEINFKLNFMCYARVDLLRYKDQLRKMVEFGVKGMYFGIESLRPETARKIGKGFSGKKLKNYLIEIKKQYPKLHLTTSWIVGLPNEPIEEFEENLKWVLDNKVTDSFFIHNLLIPKDNGMNLLSPFTKSWPEHGYEEMTESEIDLYLKDKGDKNFYRILQEYLTHFIPWKNKHMNFIDAYYYCSDLRNKYKDSIKTTGWFAFCHSFHTSDLDKILHTKKNDFDWISQQKKVEDFISNYKKNKIKSLE